MNITGSHNECSTPALPAPGENSLESRAPAESAGVLCRNTAHPRANSVAELVAAQAVIKPGAMAVSSSRCVLSYGELDNRASELARALAGLGVGPERVVGLLAPRSPAMVVGALGILKAGGAYLPLDPSFPEARLAFQLEDAQASVLVTAQSVKIPRALGEHELILLDEGGRMVEAPSSLRNISTSPTSNANDLAYVIYTSGSTGQPKGVEVTHANLLNLVDWHQRAFKITGADRASQVAKVGFDAAVWEIWPYLTSGSSLHQPDEPLLSEPEALQRWLLDEDISVAFIPTPLAERLLTLPWPAKTALRVMLTGGDVLHSYAPKDSPFLLVNNYGPTECTVVATSALVPPQDSVRGLPPIGLPIQNTQLYVLDESGNQVAPGQRGELYIGGCGLARGYRNRPLVTAERFLLNPFSRSPGERFFKTGDLVRVLLDGQFAFLGRLDDQIKIRGFRVEPDEIAAALNEHPAIMQSVVAAHEVSPGDRRLVGYFVPRTQSCPTFSELHEFLGARLPEFMVPGVLVALEHLPLTPNGKVDRAALPAPDKANTLRDSDFVAPRTEVERTVAAILACLLGVDRVDVDDNFFALGGHSLLGTQLISRVRQTFGVGLTLRHVFEAPTVAGISAQIERMIVSELETMSEERARSLLASVQLRSEQGRANDQS